MSTSLVSPVRATSFTLILLRVTGVALVPVLGAVAWTLLAPPHPSSDISTGPSVVGQSQKAVSKDLVGTGEVAGIPSGQHLGQDRGTRFPIGDAEPPPPSPPVLTYSLEGESSHLHPAIGTAAQSVTNEGESVDRDANLVTDTISAPAFIDLNSATVAQLNSLRGGALIGRAIVRGRPYATPEDLLRKRIVRRSTYERVKDQIIVR